MAVAHWQDGRPVDGGSPRRVVSSRLIGVVGGGSAPLVSMPQPTSSMLHPGPSGVIRRVSPRQHFEHELLRAGETKVVSEKPISREDLMAGGRLREANPGAKLPEPEPRLSSGCMSARRVEAPLSGSLLSATQARVLSPVMTRPRTDSMYVDVAPWPGPPTWGSQGSFGPVAGPSHDPRAGLPAYGPPMQSIRYPEPHPMMQRSGGPPMHPAGPYQPADFWGSASRSPGPMFPQPPQGAGRPRRPLRSERGPSYGTQALNWLSRTAHQATGGLLGDATAGEEEAAGTHGTSQIAGVLAEQPFPSEHMPPGASGPAIGFPPAWSSMPPTGPRGPEAFKMGPPQPMACTGHMPPPQPAMASMGSFSQSCAAPMRYGDVNAGGFGSSSQVLPSQIPAQHMPPVNTYPTAPAMYESQPSASTYCNGGTAPGMDHMTSPYTQQYPHSHPMPGEHPYPALQSPPQPHEPTPNQPAPDAAHAYPDLAPPDNFYDSPSFQPTHQPAYDVPP
ncbi:unnamed protein product, partial [Symbiodinium sp. CCMP2456]